MSSNLPDTRGDLKRTDSKKRRIKFSKESLLRKGKQEIEDDDLSSDYSQYTSQSKTDEYSNYSEILPSSSSIGKKERYSGIYNLSLDEAEDSEKNKKQSVGAADQKVVVSKKSKRRQAKPIDEDLERKEVMEAYETEIRRTIESKIPKELTTKRTRPVKPLVEDAYKPLETVPPRKPDQVEEERKWDPPPRRKKSKLRKKLEATSDSLSKTIYVDTEKIVPKTAPLEDLREIQTKPSQEGVKPLKSNLKTPSTKPIETLPAEKLEPVIKKPLPPVLVDLPREELNVTKLRKPELPTRQEVIKPALTTELPEENTAKMPTELPKLEDSSRLSTKDLYQSLKTKSFLSDRNTMASIMSKDTKSLGQNLWGPQVCSRCTCYHENPVMKYYSKVPKEEEVKDPPITEFSAEPVREFPEEAYESRAERALPGSYIYPANTPPPPPPSSRQE